MNDKCVLNIEQFNCPSTPARDCYAKLKDHCDAGFTSLRNIEPIVKCKNQIVKKDPEYEFQIGKLLNIDEEKRANLNNHLYQIFTDTTYNIWKLQLTDFKDIIEPMKLVAYFKKVFKECLNEIDGNSRDDKKKIIDEFEKILKLILDSFKNHPDYPLINNSLEEFYKSKFKTIKDKINEEVLREKLENYYQKKAWFHLFQFIETIEKDIYSNECYQLLEKRKKEAEDGKEWKRHNRRLGKLFEKEDIKTPLSFLEECRKFRKNIAMVNKEYHKYGENKSNQLKEGFYCKLKSLMTLNYSPETAFEQLGEIEDVAKTLFPEESREWKEYRESLNISVKEIFEKSLKEIFSTIENPGELNNRLEVLLSKPANKKITIEKHSLEYAKESTGKLAEISMIMDSILMQKKVEYIMNYNSVLKDLETVYINIKSREYKSDVLKGRWAVYKAMDKRFEYTQRILSAALGILEKIQTFIGTLEEESGKIIRGDLSLDINHFKEDCDKIETVSTQLRGKNGNVKLLSKLNETALGLRQLIFKTHEGLQIGDSEFLLIQLIEKIEAGNQIYDGIKNLTIHKGDDLSGQVNAFAVLIDNNRNKPFILEDGKDKKGTQMIKQIINKINEWLKGIRNSLEKELVKLYPLPTRENLDKFQENINSIGDIKMAIGGLTGFRELILMDDQKLAELKEIIDLEKLIQQEKYGEADDSFHNLRFISRDFQEQLKIAIFYYKHLHMKAWDETHWLTFFDRYYPLILNSNKSDGKWISAKYEYLLEENLFMRATVNLQKHFDIFKKYLKNSKLFPYMALLSRNCNVAAFLEDIDNNEPATIVFPGFLKYIEKQEWWHSYWELFKNCKDNLKDSFGSNPTEKVMGKLEDRYFDLKEKFELGDINKQELLFFKEYFPRDDIFKELKEDFDKLLETFNGNVKN